MKNRLMIIVVLTVLAAFAAADNMVFAQNYNNTPVSISSEKVRIEGKLFYSHRVIERQTLFSISKAYNVSIEDIYQANPTLKETGLVKGSRILIPAETVQNQITGSEKNPAEQTEPEENVREDRQEPVKDNRTQTAGIISFDEVDYQIHTVKWYENLQSIARKYNISEDLLIAFNKLESTVLKRRQKIRIPEQQYIQELERSIRGGNAARNVQQGSTQGEAVSEKTEATAVFTNADALKGDASVCLVLPLGCSFDGGNANTNYMDFYSGALLASRELASNGADIHLTLLDTDGFNTCADIAYHKSVMGADIIIGPVMSKDLQQLVSNTDKLVISPLDPKAESLTGLYSNIVQAPTPVAEQYNNIAETILRNRKAGEQVVVISEVGGSNSSEKSTVIAGLQQRAIAYKDFSYNILQGRGVDITIAQMLNTEMNNHIVIASENEAFVNDVIRNINTLVTMRKYKITTYGSSKLRNFETIEVEHFHNCNLHLAMNYFVDYDDERTMKFILEYRALFNTEPTPFAFQGYDLMMYFTKAVYALRGGNSLEDIPEMPMLQSNMKFERVNKGYSNTATRDIVFKRGYQVELESK